ncbi:phage holin [Ligilactobacillus sp. 110_WCHN]|uniref:phage holin n=1 Tax=Ligilactobacillus sp. 110_WCHN TaxID=3057125 RepID=UPI0026715FBE|nr:phage holin [Ligilactobacillus sp. 110_WCHN]MDO3394053.1 phage holin [Ligilactobacillus sp. 110_WCHN]
MTNTITQIIVAVAGVLTPVICGYVANLIKKYIPDKSLLQALGQFAQDAVVVAEKAGVTDKLLDKKQYAINKLQDMLEHAGFSKQNEELLGSCVEHAYCELKHDIESVYKAPAVSDTKPVAEKPKEKVYKLSEMCDKDGNIIPELMKGVPGYEEK